MVPTEMQKSENENEREKYLKLSRLSFCLCTLEINPSLNLCLFSLIPDETQNIINVNTENNSLDLNDRELK